jgi:hypothetical protein
MARGWHPKGGIRVRAADPSESSPEEVPKEVIEQAKAAFSHRTQGDIAVLVGDSLVDEGAPPSDHRLSFEHPRMRIVVHLVATAGWSSLQGEVQPPTPLGVELVSEEGVGVATDVTDGAFTIERVPSGVVRLRLKGPAGTPAVYTDWFRV